MSGIGPPPSLSSAAPAVPAAAEGWPSAADPAAAARLAESFAALGAAEARFARSGAGRACLAALGGNAPFLADLALKEPAMLRAAVQESPEAALGRAWARLAQTPVTARTASLGAALRRAKRQVALTVAAADISGLWPLERVTAALSAFAEEALRRATAHLLHLAHQDGALAHPEAADSGFIVLGMGKLGAGELNFSSDIDLVLLYDPDATSLAGKDPARNAAIFARLAQNLVSLLERRDAEGYVFRTDLRLRPDPAATPPAVALPSALTYYESLAQNWERAAFVKARPVAGDLAAGAAFLEAIRPFVWRKGLDFTSVADLHALKRRIDRAGPLPGPSAAQLAGIDVKRGAGGIRDIEFIAQTLALVWGGRTPSLRVPATLEALPALARASHLSRAACADLSQAYRFLRTVEHRLQMEHDRQTHALPKTADGFDRLAVFLGFPGAETLAAALAGSFAAVRAHYADVFEPVSAASAAPLLDLSGPDPAPEALARLQAIGFRAPAAAWQTVRAWQAGGLRALRADRARQLLEALLPDLLQSFGRQADPDAALARFDRLLGRLQAGVQTLTLLQRNKALLDRIASILGAAPALADYLAQTPAALEGLVTPSRPPSPARVLAGRLRDAKTFEDTLGILRRTRAESEFAIAVDTLEARTDADAAGFARTALAEACLAALLPRVEREVIRRFGQVPGGQAVLVALGKAGSREMMAGSDLDLMLIYDHPLAVQESRPPAGGRAVPTPLYYARFTQAVIGALTAPGREGLLYAVDMRLRPSGNAGPVAVSLTALRRYHRERAWTFERMALTRARVVAGPRLLTARVTDAIITILEDASAMPTLAHDAAAMRARLARDAPPKTVWDLKHADGGLIEVEFIAQILQLRHAGHVPGLATQNTAAALRALAASGLLAGADAEMLTGAGHLFRTVEGMLRIVAGRTPPATLPDPAAEALLRAVRRSHGRVTDQASLHALLGATRAAVRAAFIRLVGTPDPILLETPP